MGRDDLLPFAQLLALEALDEAAVNLARPIRREERQQVERWRRFNGHQLVADVLAGAQFKDGIRVTEDDTTTQDRVAA
jgi:hypothetical protein